MTASDPARSLPIDRDRARRFAFRIVGDGVTAEDMVQEATLRVLGKDGLPEGTDRLQRYFYRALTNVCLDQLPRAERERRALAHEVEPPPATAAADRWSELRDERARVHQALQDLPARQRAAIVLKEWEGLGYREIGDRLDVSESNAATLVYRGMQQLRRRLSRKEGR